MDETSVFDDVSQIVLCPGYQRHQRGGRDEEQAASKDGQGEASAAKRI